MSDQGYGKRFVTGFAIVGLLVAGIIGVWTWQTNSHAPSPHRNASVEDRDIAETQTTTRPSPQPSRTPAPEAEERSSVAHTRSTSETTTSNIAPLGADPYLPPNTWGGSGDGLTQPTSTFVADGINPETTDAPSTTTAPTQAPALPTELPELPTTIIPTIPQPDYEFNGNGSSEPDRTSARPSHPLLDIIPPRWRPDQMQAPTDTTAETFKQPEQ